MITATAQKPTLRAFTSNEGYTLGHWKGAILVSPAENEAQLRLLMRAADQIFARTEATLRRTLYWLRCWLKSYHTDSFYPKAVDVLPGRSGYFTL